MGILGKEADMNVVNAANARNRKKSSRGRVVEIQLLRKETIKCQKP